MGVNPNHEIFGVPYPGPWRLDGACRDVHTKTFFPTKRTDAAPAKAICARCTVIQPCRAYALEHVLLEGVWGGCTEDERHQLRRRPRLIPHLVSA